MEVVKGLERKVSWLVQPGGDEAEDRLHPGLQLPTGASGGADADLPDDQQQDLREWLEVHQGRFRLDIRKLFLLSGWLVTGTGS